LSWRQILSSVSPIYVNKTGDSSDGILELPQDAPIGVDVREYLNLNELLVKREEATFFVRVEGRSMVNAGIYPNDILIVDRSLNAKHRSIVIAVIDGEVTVKRLFYKNNEVFLQAENSQFKDIPVLGELHIWGVVTSVIHKFV